MKIVIGILFAFIGTGMSETFDENTLFLIEKINDYVENKYNNDYTSAINAFDENSDGKLDNDELWYALKNLEIGTYVTRTYWVTGIIDYFTQHGHFDSFKLDAIIVSDLVSLVMYSSGIN
jgi:Ca2+-binding EF-hand superfamily protein